MGQQVAQLLDSYMMMNNFIRVIKSEGCDGQGRALYIEETEKYSEDFEIITSKRERDHLRYIYIYVRKKSYEIL
jgi:hypothetical protein